MSHTSCITKISRCRPPRNNTFTIHASVRAAKKIDRHVTRQYCLEQNLSTIRSRYQKPSVTVARCRRSVTLVRKRFSYN